MDSGRAREREMIKIADHAPKSILRNVYSNENADERSPSRMASGSGLSRHRVGVSPVRVKRSINESVPTAVVMPSPPICKSILTASSELQGTSKKPNSDTGPIRYFSFRAAHSEIAPAQSEGAPTHASGGTATNTITPFARRSRSSVGSTHFSTGTFWWDEELRSAPSAPRHQQERNQRIPWPADSLDAECQVPSNSILTLHSLDDSHDGYPRPRDDSQERRLKQLEAKLRDLEMRLGNSNSPSKRYAVGEAAPGVPKNESPKATAFSASEVMPVMSTQNSNAATKGKTNFGVVSVAVPPMMALDGGIYRVQPTARSEAKVQHEIERLEKKLKHQEEMAEALRVQHLRQIEQLTRQLASNDDMTQTLRSRIRELELENELWQNRFRLYNDVDVAKILRENERLRSRQRKRSSRGEEENNELQRKKEQIEEEHEKLRARYDEMDQKYRALKDKYKDTVKSYRTRRRQDHIEVESLKVTVELQNAELKELRERVLEQALEERSANAASTSNVPVSGYVTYNLEKCLGITECLSNVCTHLKRNEPLDPTDVLDYGSTSSGYSTNDRDGKKTACDEKPLEETIDCLANKMTQLHSMVVDLYGDDLANAVSCNVQ